MAEIWLNSELLALHSNCFPSRFVAATTEMELLVSDKDVRSGRRRHE